jgi:iron complex outermembrane receptor protein
MTAAALIAATTGANQAAAQGSDGGIDEVVVQGRYVQSYKLDNASGTKMDIDLLDQPRSVQVLSREFLDDIGALEISDVYGQVAGVSNDPYASNISRGFRQEEIRYNGLVGDPYISFNQPQLFNVERIEFLRGPAAVLYGGAEPGGFINYVTKKPRDEFEHTLTAQVGSFDRSRISGESTGPVGDSEAVLYRVGVLYDDSKQFRKNTNREDLIYTAAFTFNLADATALTLEGERIEQEWAGWRVRGVPVDLDGNFLTDIDFSANESTDEQDLEANVLHATLDHRFSDALRADFSARWVDSEGDQGYHEARFLADDGRTLSREYRDINETTETLSFMGNLHLDTGIGGFEQKWLAGVEYYSVEFRQAFQRVRGFEGVPSIDILEPVYGQADVSSYPLVPASEAQFSLNELDRIGVYAQTNLTFGPVSFMLGARYDDFKDESRADENAPAPDSTTEDDNVSLRAGVVYKPADNASLYASYTESFSPPDPGSQARPGGPFDPTAGEQIEIGFKVDWLDGQIRTGIAAYSIDKTNILVTDPDPDALPFSLLQVGAVSSEGIEVEVIGDITPALTLSANYAYNDVQEEENPLGDAAGSSGLDQLFRNKPEHQAGAWLRYAPSLPALEAATGGSLVFGLGAEYVSERQNFDGGLVKEYTKFDGNIRFELERYDFQLHVYNLFDEEYVAAPNFFLLDFPGAPRTITLQARARF